MTVFLHVFFTKLVKFGRIEVSIPPIDAKFQDLSIQRVVKGWFLIFGCEKSVFHPFFVVFFKKKKGFRHEIDELSLGRNNRLGLGTSKIKVLAKNTKKKQGKSMIFIVFPACGVGFLTSSWFLPILRQPWFRQGMGLEPPKGFFAGFGE